MTRFSRLLLGLTGLLPVGLTMNASASLGAAPDEIAAAANLRRGQPPLTAQPDGVLICEAEEFQPDGPGWQAIPWGANYYAATLANTFLSRKACLSAPPQADSIVASLTVQVPQAGKYLLLARYEAVYRFETRFQARIEQQGQIKLDRPYGARQNPKVWAFGNKLKDEVKWPWGAVENVVWEGHDALVDLDAGPATITLLATTQPEPAARRNVDVLVLTPHLEQVRERIESDSYLPLDGLLTQAGDVYLRLHNAADAPPMTLIAQPCTEHSPYWVHRRVWKPIEIAAASGQSTDWVETGSLLDTLNDGQWMLSSQPAEKLHYQVEVGLKGADGAIEPIGAFESLLPQLELAYDANTRYTRRIRRVDDVLYDLLADVKQQPLVGTPPRRTPIFAVTFNPRPDDARYTAARDEFTSLFGLSSAAASLAASDPSQPRGYIDVRGQSPAQLDELGRKLQAEGTAAKVAVVSLGDEIGLSTPDAGAQAIFAAWLQSQGVKRPADVDPTAGDDWTKVTYNPDPKLAETLPALFYYSSLFRHHYGIERQKELTDALAKYMPQAGIGANFSPHHGHPYLGETHAWITLFRRGGMNMPWSEDYIWQVPVGTQQMNFLGLDMFRSGLKGRPQAKIQYYVMPHWPGNTPANWRRQFYGDLGHGMKIVNLFEFRPVQAAYTENHVSLPAMYHEVRRSFYELARFEDVIQEGRVRPGGAALWFSETGDIWQDNLAPFAAGKRTLYIAVRQQQLPLDVVIDEDALAGDLKSYQVLYLADRHVSRAASAAISEWVHAGGRLLATAGAGMWDEFNQPNTALRELLGVDPQPLDLAPGEPIELEKQDLPWAEPMDQVTWTIGGASQSLRVFGVRSRFVSAGGDVLATLTDGSPAVTRKRHGPGEAIYCGFLPGLSYFQPAMPKEPVDRSSTDRANAHFIPTQFDAGAGYWIGLVSQEVKRPVACSQPLVESCVVESAQGVVIPLINWSPQTASQLRVTVALDAPRNKAELASGQPLVEEPGAAPGERVFLFDLEVADALMLR